MRHHFNGAVGHSRRAKDRNEQEMQEDKKEKNGGWQAKIEPRRKGYWPCLAVRGRPQTASAGAGAPLEPTISRAQGVRGLTHTRVCGGRDGGGRRCSDGASGRCDPRTTRLHSCSAICSHLPPEQRHVSVPAFGTFWRRSLEAVRQRGFFWCFFFLRCVLLCFLTAVLSEKKKKK